VIADFSFEMVLGASWTPTGAVWHKSDNRAMIVVFTWAIHPRNS